MKKTIAKIEIKRNKGGIRLKIKTGIYHEIFKAFEERSMQTEATQVIVD